MIHLKESFENRYLEPDVADRSETEVTQDTEQKHVASGGHRSEGDVGGCNLARAKSS